MKNYIRFGVCLALASSLVFAAEHRKIAAKPSIKEQGSVTAKMQKASTNGVTSRAAGDSQYLANFTVAAMSCMRVDSTLDLSTSDNVAISIVSAGNDITSTRIIPFFSQDSSTPFIASGIIIYASEFFYIDGGGATVPVLGRNLFLRVCNDASADIQYDLVSARASVN